MRSSKEMTENKDRSEPVEVLVPGDAGTLALAKSLLGSAGIAYFVKNENVQGLFGWDQLGFWPPAIMVSASDAEAARELLEPLMREAERKS
jgi:hypothetical protein